MKKLIILLGPHAVGKSSVCNALLGQCPHSAYVDEAWCRQMNPAALTNATKKTVTENLYALLYQDLCCPDIQWVFFPFHLYGEWEGILQNLLHRLDAQKLEFQVHTIVLTCEPQELLRRGIEAGREPEQLNQALLRSTPCYGQTELPQIDTTGLNLEQTCQAVLTLLEQAPTPPTKARRLVQWSKKALWLLVLPVLILAGFLLGRQTSPAPQIIPMSVQASEPTQPPESTSPTSIETSPVTEPTVPPTDATTEPASEEATQPSTESTEPETPGDSQVQEYVINTNSQKFHLPECGSVAKMKPSNQEFFTGTRQTLIDRGYSPCGNCKP